MVISHTHLYDRSAMSKPDGSPTQLRERQIKLGRAEAQRLIRSFKGESMRDLVRAVERDLTEAECWLAGQHIDLRPSILDIVDFHIRIALYRLEQIAAWLRKYGAGADVLGAPQGVTSLNRRECSNSRR